MSANQEYHFVIRLKFRSKGSKGLYKHQRGGQERLGIGVNTEIMGPSRRNYVICIPHKSLSRFLGYRVNMINLSVSRWMKKCECESWSKSVTLLVLNKGLLLIIKAYLFSYVGPLFFVPTCYNIFTYYFVTALAALQECLPNAPRSATIYLIFHKLQECF